MTFIVGFIYNGRVHMAGDTGKTIDAGATGKSGHLFL